MILRRIAAGGFSNRAGLRIIIWELACIGDEVKVRVVEKHGSDQRITIIGVLATQWREGCI